MPRPRRSHLFELDATVLSTSAALVRTREKGLGRFYGLELASVLGRERSTVYKSLHRLVELGLLVDEWDAGRRYYRLTEFGRWSAPHARARVFGRTDERPRAGRRRVRGMTTG